MKIYDLNELEDLFVSLHAGVDSLLKKNVYTVKATSPKEALKFILENDPEYVAYADFIGMILDELLGDE